MTDHKEQQPKHDEQPQGQAYDTSRDMPHEGAPVSDPRPKKPVPMTAGTPPRPMTPNEIIATGRSTTAEPPPQEEAKKEKEK